jgi:hypothetical protein
LAEEKPVTLDPHPTNLHEHMWDQIGVGDLQPEDLANPATIRVLIHSHRLTAAHLRQAELERDGLKAEVKRLASEKEQLLVQAADLHRTSAFAWVEILVSGLVGFGINIITSDPKVAFGWVAFVLGVVILLLMRFGIPKQNENKK